MDYNLFDDLGVEEIAQMFEFYNNQDDVAEFIDVAEQNIESVKRKDEEKEEEQKHKEKSLMCFETLNDLEEPTATVKKPMRVLKKRKRQHPQQQQQPITDYNALESTKVQNLQQSSTLNPLLQQQQQQQQAILTAVGSTYRDRRRRTSPAQRLPTPASTRMYTFRIHAPFFLFL